jgi:hypothetical protein
MSSKNDIAILFIHHTKSDITIHNYNLLKKYNPNSSIFPVGFEWHDLMEGSHVVRRSDELPNNIILNNILSGGKSTSTESDLYIYDFFLHHQDFDSYFVIEWDTYCNASIEECYGEAMKKYDTFSANIFTNEKPEGNSASDFESCVICDNYTNVPVGTSVQGRTNYIDGIGHFCPKCYNEVDKTKYIQVKRKRSYVKEWSWYKYLFSKLNEPTEQQKLLPYLGGTYPTSLLYYKHKVLHDIVGLLLENPRLYDNIQNEMRLGTLIQQAGYRLEIYGYETNQFREQPHYHHYIKNNIKGYYHPIKEIL